MLMGASLGIIFIIFFFRPEAKEPPGTESSLFSFLWSQKFYSQVALDVPFAWFFLQFFGSVPLYICHHKSPCKVASVGFSPWWPATRCTQTQPGRLCTLSMFPLGRHCQNFLRQIAQNHTAGSGGVSGGLWPWFFCIWRVHRASPCTVSLGSLSLQISPHDSQPSRLSLQFQSEHIFSSSERHTAI